MNTRPLAPIVSIAMALFLFGCGSTGVVPIGGDTYMIARSGTALGVGSKIKAEIYQEANAWCERQGLVLVPISESATDGIAGESFASAEIKFKAVKPGEEPKNRRDRFGATSADYLKLAEQYEAEGQKEMAKLARERAAALR